MDAYRQRHAGIEHQHYKVADFPFVANINVVKYSTWFVCSGIFIDKNQVITSADCVTDADGQAVAEADIRVRDTTQDLANNDTLAVRSVLVHQGYNATKYVNNLAVLTLDASVSNWPTQSMPHIAVEAPTTADLAHVGWTKDLTVFGAQDSFDSDIMVYLEPTTTVCSTTAQNKIRDFSGGYHDRQYACAPYDWKSAHPVFTGGSVLATTTNDTWYFYGLENYELKDDAHKTFVFTRLSHHLAWLEIAAHRTAKNMTGRDDPYGDLDQPSGASSLPSAYLASLLWAAVTVAWTVTM
ncbi:hypothetical protein H4R34_001285 [Dimargaris verticillata]|uniref:Peptidase S1 domain-containing protein n=1 Tax=Dimargaris verticillata TaxID=2761393 RepID=A0A9W8EB24_9FUNG|nr:hypothetical protein H4R34_001285 [Dimargaris verticillata]